MQELVKEEPLWVAGVATSGASSKSGGAPAGSTKVWTSSAVEVRSIVLEAQLPAPRHGTFRAGTGGSPEPELVLGVFAPGGVYPLTPSAIAKERQRRPCDRKAESGTQGP